MNPATRPVPAGWLRQDLAIAAAAAALVLAWDFAGLDLATMRAFGDADGFAWKNQWLTRGLLHEGGRLLGFAVLALLLFNIWRPLLPVPLRRERVRWVLMTVIGVLAVPALKQISATSCPWDLAEFGGVARYVSHWQFGVGDGGPGRCFPSGHATAAFAFFSGYFVLRNHHPQAARLWLAGVLLAGLAFGWGQMVRGAHYPSHTLWTAWLCWALNALMAPRPAPAMLRAAPAR